MKVSLRPDPVVVDRQRRLQAASDLLREGQREDAARRLRTLVAEVPTLAQAHRLLGVALHEMGDLAGAEAAFRNALRHEPGLAMAATGLSEILRAGDRVDEAVSVLAPFMTPETTNLSLLTYFGLALQSAGRLDEAISALTRAAEVNPVSAVAEHNLAGALCDAQQFQSGEGASRRAFAKGLDAPEAWLTLARLLSGLDRMPEANAAYAEALARRPAYAEAAGELAQLVWMSTGDAAAARAVFAEAAGAAPAAPLLLQQKAKLLDTLGDGQGAYQALAQALALDDEAMLHVPAAQLAVHFDTTLALDHARRAFAQRPDNPSVIAALCQTWLARGDADEATRIAETLVRRLPIDQYALALLATAWRLKGDPRAGRLYDYEHSVRRWKLAAPAGWPSLEAWLADLRAALRPLHRFQGHPVGQSLRSGSQTRQDLTLSADPAIRALFQVIDAPIRAHIAALGPGQDPLRRRASGGYRLNGAWSVNLRPGGFHVDHVHPKGWLSSALHIELPAAVETEPQGWLKFGEPGIPTLPALPPEHFVKPEAGWLVLFPSYMWHGTVPFQGDQPRLTVAFDVIPS